MAHYFPHQTGAFKLEEPPAIQRWSRRLVPMALFTGVVLRLLRALTLSGGPDASILFMSGMVIVGIVVLCGMAALHLASYTLRHWTWRAPAFAVLEATTEMLVSLVLISLGREPMGSSLATFGDWPELAIWTYFLRLSTVIVFAGILSLVVKAVRYQLLKREDRGGTFDAVQRDAEAQERKA